MRPDLDALSDATRRLMLALLARESELCVCEFEAALDLIQPVVSRHLGVLRDARWVSVRRDGRRVYYRLADDRPAWADQIVQAYTGGGIPPREIEVACARLTAFGRQPARRAPVPLSRMAS